MGILRSWNQDPPDPRASMSELQGVSAFKQHKALNLNIATHEITYLICARLAKGDKREREARWQTEFCNLITCILQFP